MTNRPRVLIEDWLPVAELGIESRRERAAASSLPPLSFLHIWWARRPLVASAGAILGSVMPGWSQSLADEFSLQMELQSQEAYHDWFLRLCGILGDPVAAQNASNDAKQVGRKLSKNPFSYKQAYKNSPELADIDLLHRVLRTTWSDLPTVIDPTAGGGSIPYEAIRYGLPATANDLNPVAASVLRTGVEVTSKYGSDLTDELSRWGNELVRRINTRLHPYFPSQDDEQVLNYIFARTVACPRTGKQVPLSPDWWLRKGDGAMAVRLVTLRDGEGLMCPEFELVTGKAIDFDPSNGTISGGDATSPWDGLIISGDYIKEEAQAGRMGSVLYAVAIRKGGKRAFRAPVQEDLDAITHAEEELARLAPAWAADDVLPIEEVPAGQKTPELLNKGMDRWTDIFSPRQRLAHGMFVSELRALIPEIRSAVEDQERADALLALLAMMQGKALNWNALLSSWNVLKQGMRSVFDTHNFAFKSTYAEFEAGVELFPWCLSQLLDAYKGISGLLEPSQTMKIGAESAVSAVVPGSVSVMRGTAGDLDGVETGSQTLVCIDPPYYDNVMYAELSDFFYVWEKRTLGRIWPEFFEEELTDKKNEAVANPARFVESGKRRKELANADYEAKMTAIFAECYRVLREDGVLTVMFTHKRAEAWDTLGMSLMEAGFTIETSWPVPTEPDNGLHQAGKNAATSTIFLVCRKRPEGGGSVFFEDVEAQVRDAARSALTRFSAFGIDGVDLLLSTYGPALSVISSQWPVYSSEADPETGKSRLLRPEEALDAARGELVRLQRQRLIGRAAQLDPLTDFVLLSWQIFKAREFPFDEARRLALAVGGLDIDALVRAKIVDKKAGTVSLVSPDKRVRRQADLEAGLPGIYLEKSSFTVIIDAVHTAMHLADQDGPAAAKAWMDRVGLTGDQRFQAAVQGLVNAMPRSKTKDKWDIPEAEWLDALCFYFPDVTVPEVRLADDQGTQESFDFSE
jgi:putative DNA methylase